MVEQFKKVLESIVIPQFPEVAYVRVNQFGMGDYFRVKYYLKEKWEGTARPIDLMNETVSMYKMMSPDPNGDVFIEFYHIRDDEGYEEDV